MNIINATELYTLKMVIMAKFMSYILPQLKKINNVIQKEFNCMVCELYLNKCVGQKTKPKKKTTTTLWALWPDRPGHKPQIGSLPIMTLDTFLKTI